MFSAFWGWVGPCNNGPARAHRTEMCFEVHAKDPPEGRMGYDAGVGKTLKQLLGERVFLDCLFFYSEGSVSTR